jgi:hypothetical protein
MIVPRGIGAYRGLGGLVQDLAGAIARQEGANPAYNNPGALRTPSSGPWPGQIDTSPSGFAIFSNYASGEAALESQVQTNINRGLTLNQFFAGQRDASGNVIPGGYPGYAPAADSNQPNVYTAHVSQWAGVPSDVPLNSIDAGAVDAAGVPVDFSGSDVLTVDSSGWYWAAAVGAALILAWAMD